MAPSYRFAPGYLHFVRRLPALRRERLAGRLLARDDATRGTPGTFRTPRRNTNDLSPDRMMETKP
jgi:hypothetical protein